MHELMNGVSKEFLKQYISCEDSNDKSFTVLYSGNMGLAQDLETLIAAAKILKDYKISFTFVGEGVCKQKIVSLSQSISEKINFYKPVNREKLIKHIKRSSVCIVPLKNRKLFESALPSKMFEYMACERPIIVGVKGEAKKIVEQAKAGIAIEPEDPVSLSEAILKYYNNRQKCKIDGKNGMIYVTNNLSKEVLISNIMSNIKIEQKTI